MQTSDRRWTTRAQWAHTINHFERVVFNSGKQAHCTCSWTTSTNPPNCDWHQTTKTSWLQSGCCSNAFHCCMVSKRRDTTVFDIHRHTRAWTILVQIQTYISFVVWTVPEGFVCCCLWIASRTSFFCCREPLQAKTFQNGSKGSFCIGFSEMQCRSFGKCYVECSLWLAVVGNIN